MHAIRRYTTAMQSTGRIGLDRAVNALSRSFETHPLITNAAAGVVVTTTGDALSQRAMAYNRDEDYSHSWDR